MSDLMVPFDKVIEILSETVSSNQDEICIALEELKIQGKESVHWSREQDSHNQAIDDAIKVVRNH